LPPYLGSFTRAQVGLVLAFAALTMYFAAASPRIPVASGYGWDGQVYGRCAVDLVECVQSRTLSSYNLGRIFPSTLVHSFFAATGTKAEPSSVVRAFAALNLAAIAGSVLLWLDVCRRRAWRPASALCGCAALFFNFAVLRLPFYAPVYTDIVALFLATCCLWLHVVGRPRLTLVLLPFAAFTWPAAIPVIACVAVLRPRGTGMPAFRSVTLLPAAGAAAFLALQAYFLFVDPQPRPYGGAQVHREWLALSLLAMTTYVFWAVRALRVEVPMRTLRIDASMAVATVIAVAAYFAARLMLDRFAGPPSAMNVETFLRWMTETGILYPAHFLAAHVAFAGPWIIALVALAPLVTAHALREDPVSYAVLALALLFMLSSETRWMMFFLPFAVYAWCSRLDGRVSERESVAFAALSLALSHFWLPMEGLSFDQLLDFPAQRMFMHIGPWVGERGYALIAAQMLLAVAVMAASIRKLAR
jgi:hypothetical protein